jgi:hypothetical protein
MEQTIRRKRPVPHMQISIDNTPHLWPLLQKQNYDQLQPLLELIDNAVAEPTAATIINVAIDFEAQLGYVEDNGIGLPTDAAELARCLTFAAASPTDLNEHGCGLKASLAFMDPSNSRWRIVWKRDGEIYEIRPPYTSTITVTRCETWPGKYNGPTGTYIEFPVAKEGFAALYATPKAKCTDPLPRIREEFSQYWMFNDRIRGGKIQLHLNGEYIEPFRMTVYAEPQYVEYFKGHDTELSTGAKVQIMHYKIVENIPNSWFKKAMSSNGYYIFKNGRLIKRIHSGRLYRQLYGAEADNHHNGFIVLVNVVGNQAQCPHTSTTKNDFPSSDKFTHLCDVIRAHVKPDVSKAPPSEETLVQQFRSMQQNTIGRLLKEKYTIEEKKSLLIVREDGTTFKGPQIDIIETVGDDINIYEAKRTNMVEFPHIRQLYGNWIITAEKYAVNTHVTPILLLNVKQCDFTMPEAIQPQVAALAANSKRGFPLLIINYEGEELYRYT